MPSKRSTLAILTGFASCWFSCALYRSQDGARGSMKLRRGQVFLGSSANRTDYPDYFFGRKPKWSATPGNNLNDPFGNANEKSKGTALECGVSEQVTARSNKWSTCPSTCPLFAEHKGDGIHCDFRCVGSSIESCKVLNPMEPIPDPERGICRSCIVGGCQKCSIDGTDTCSMCSPGHYLQDGLCYNSFIWAWIIIGTAISILLAFAISWIISLAIRPVTNQSNLDAGLAHRSRSKLRMPRTENGGGSLWPLTTNLCTQDVAGPGIQLEFNFQLALIVWAFLVALGWYILSTNVHEELLMLGLHRAETSRQNCIVVQFGYMTQQALMKYKVRFVASVYVISFFLALALGVKQLRSFQQMDAKMTTHKDFCARVHGIPLLKGTEKLEEEMKSMLVPELGKPIVGVSICWDYDEKESEVMEVIQDALAELEVDPVIAEMSSEPPTSRRETTMAGAGEPKGIIQNLVWLFRKIEKKIANILLGEKNAEMLVREAEDQPVYNVKKMLDDLETSGQGFVLFETEADRDAGVQLCRERGGIPFRDALLHLEATTCEPRSVNWQNCSRVEKTLWWQMQQAVWGGLMITAALGIWVFVFYAPYAYIMMSFNYAYGQEPGIVVNLAFTVVVVVGNALMYFTCSEIADRVRFEAVDNREVVYMLLYSFACCLNVALDMIVTYYMAYLMMVGVGMKTIDGVPLAEVDHFTERFETYAMQRALGQNLMAYAFPSTFLVPFIFEPIGTIYLPRKLMSWIVGSQRLIGKWTAECCLTAFPMDLSRYADLLLNVMLAVLVFYFPGGFTHRLFLALALSHVVIYALDHYKVLRCIPSCHFSSHDVDWWAQWMLSIPLGLILSSLTFKANCTEGLYCVHGFELIGLTSMVFLLHVIVHTWVLRHIVPKFGFPEASSAHSVVKYRDCAEKYVDNFFSTNPVNCLRSAYLYEHFPPCDFCMPGKEHIIRKNESIGLYFIGAKADAENFKSLSLHEIQAEINTVVTDLVSRSKNFSRKSLFGIIGMESTPSLSPHKEEEEKEEGRSNLKDDEEADSSSQNSPEEAVEKNTPEAKSSSQNSPEKEKSV